jgi:hypothetical protein
MEIHQVFLLQKKKIPLVCNISMNKIYLGCEQKRHTNFVKGAPTNASEAHSTK